MSAELHEFVKSIRMGEIQRFGSMSVLPVFSTLPIGPDFHLLSEAENAQNMRVEEVNTGGVVANAKVINMSSLPLLLIEGEELKGAKQNRIINVTMLVQPNVETVIPVTCVEQRRWRHVSKQFTASNNMLPLKMREKAKKMVSRNMERSGSRSIDQYEIWRDVENLHKMHRVHPDTMAMNDVYDKETPRLDDSLKSFNIAPKQQGMLVFLDGKVAGLDYFSSDEAFAPNFQKLIRSYALETIDSKNMEENSSESELAEHFLNDLEKCAIHKFPSLGYGEDLRIEGEGLSGSALWYEGACIHLSVLVSDDEEESDTQDEYLDSIF